MFTLGHRLFKTLSDSNTTFSSINSTLHNGGTSDIPIKILESVVPGYGAASRFLLHYFSIDISLYVSVFAILYALNKVAKFLFSLIKASFFQYCTATIHIDGDDDLFSMFVEWISEMHPHLSPRYLNAKTQYGSAGTAAENMEHSKAFLDAALGENGIFNFGRASARIPPRFEPSHGTHTLWHTWSEVFVINRYQRDKAINGVVSNDLTEELDITCVGRSTDAIKRLLTEIKVWSVNKQTSRTEIRSPSNADHGWHRRPWTKTSERPCRPMSTVILDAEQKAKIQQDINEFLHPLSARWYAQRGIPYRRGYLFHGPPGTGKTSLSFALAGLFGLGIYIIPLMDPELSEAYLARLFNELPKRCIVLLEDIDSAGVEKRDQADNDDDEKEAFPSSRGKKSAEKGEQKANGVTKDGQSYAHTNGDTPATADGAVTNGAGEGKLIGVGETEGSSAGTKAVSAEAQDARDSPDPQKLTLTDLAKIMLSISNPDSSHKYVQRGGKIHRRKRKQEAVPASDQLVSQISLSGLLNVIDGVATHEGRVLIMTTNHPEKLDAALVRAGRVDMQVKFTYATKQQIKYLFTRMYQFDIDLSIPKTSGASEAERKEAGRKVENLTESELDTLGDRFAEELPEETFAPSDIQGYLLMYKSDAKGALEHVGAWREKRLVEMAAISKQAAKG